MWVWDLRRRTFTRLTRDEGPEQHPIWTPDGARVVFQSPDGMASTAADGTGTIEAVPNSERGSTPFSWTADGRLVFDFVSPDGRDIRVAPLDGSSPAETLLAGAFAEQRGTISPDGRWLAYESLESGEYQIYVRPFPDVDSARWQVSTAGGDHPRWSPDGGELFYRELSSDRLMAVAVTPSGAFEWDDPEPLFSVEPYLSGNARDFVVDRDDQRFLFKRPVQADTEESNRLVLVQHWDEELKRLVPVP